MIFNTQGLIPCSCYYFGIKIHSDLFGCANTKVLKAVFIVCVPAGLTHTPVSDKAEVSFQVNNMETYLPYIKAIKELLAKYEEDPQRDQMKYEDCGGSFYFRNPSTTSAACL